MGQIVKAEAKKQDLTHNDLGLLIHRHRQTVANIYKRPSIDSTLLKSICEALKVDFFLVYYQEGFLKETRYKEVNELKSENNRLNRDLTEKTQIIAGLLTAIETNRIALQRTDKVFKTYEKALARDRALPTFQEAEVKRKKPRKKS